MAIPSLPFAQAHDGQLVVLHPLDYLVWTPNLARIIEALTSQKEQPGATGIELWISGTLSPVPPIYLIQVHQERRPVRRYGREADSAKPWKL